MNVSNLIAFERNLENMNNNYRLGLVNNTDVRAAQLNLDAAKNRVNNYQIHDQTSRDWASIIGWQPGEVMFDSSF